MHPLRVALLAALMSLTLGATANAATLTLSKDSTPPLTTIAASGTGFAAGEGVALAFDGSVEANATASGSGRFSGVPVVVPDVPPGPHRVTATGKSSGTSAAARILVRTPWPMFHGS